MYFCWFSSNVVSCTKFCIFHYISLRQLSNEPWRDHNRDELKAFVFSSLFSATSPSNRTQTLSLVYTIIVKLPTMSLLFEYLTSNSCFRPVYPWRKIWTCVEQTQNTSGNVTFHFWRAIRNYSHTQPCLSLSLRTDVNEATKLLIKLSGFSLLSNNPADSGPVFSHLVLTTSGWHVLENC